LLLLRRARQGHAQDALVEPRLDLLRVRREGQAEGAVEAAVAALGEVHAALLLRAFLLLLAADGEQVALELEVDVVLAHPGQLGGELQPPLGLVDVERRGEPAHHRSAAAHRREAAEHLVEDAVHLALEGPEGIGLRGEAGAWSEES
jgi:hypothetical protein